MTAVVEVFALLESVLNSLHLETHFYHVSSTGTFGRFENIVYSYFMPVYGCFSTGRTRIVTTDCEGSHTIVLVWVFAVVAPRQETASVILVYRVENHETTSTKLLVS